MSRQLTLSLERDPDFRPEAFVASPSNSQALAALESWPRWHGGCLVLVGPEGCGKSHLASLWQARVGAARLDRAFPDLELAASQPVLIEDADQGVEDEALFHLINIAAREGAGLLLTARRKPVLWSCGLPDLRSRLNALQLAEVEEPDDQVLRAALVQLFRARNLRPADDVYAYLLTRMERSVPRARELVARIDETAGAEQRPGTRALVRQILEEDASGPDLFD